MRSATPKRARQNRVYRARSRGFLAEHPDCAARLDGCTGMAEQVHHRRGRVGDDLLDEDHWSPLCRSCHEWVTLHPADAMALGLSESRVGARS